MWAALGQEITHGPQQTETDYVASANMALDLLDSVRNQNVRLHGTYVNYLRGSGIPLDANTTGRGDTRAFDLDQYNAQAAADNGTLDTYIAETHFISEFIDSVVTMTTNSESMLEWLAHVRTGTNADATQFDIQRNRIMALMQHVRDLSMSVRLSDIRRFLRRWARGTAMRMWTVRGTLWRTGLSRSLLAWRCMRTRICMRLSIRITLERGRGSNRRAVE